MHAFFQSWRSALDASQCTFDRRSDRIWLKGIIRTGKRVWPTLVWCRQNIRDSLRIVCHSAQHHRTADLCLDITNRIDEINPLILAAIGFLQLVNLNGRLGQSIIVAVRAEHVADNAFCRIKPARFCRQCWCRFSSNAGLPGIGGVLRFQLGNVIVHLWRIQVIAQIKWFFLGHLASEKQKARCMPGLYGVVR